MDRLIYTAMTGAAATLGQQAAVAHNMANATSTGFRAELHRLRRLEDLRMCVERNVVVGDAVSFAFRKSKMGFELTSIRKTGDAQ